MSASTSRNAFRTAKPFPGRVSRRTTAPCCTATWGVLSDELLSMTYRWASGRLVRKPSSTRPIVSSSLRHGMTTATRRLLAALICSTYMVSGSRVQLVRRPSSGLLLGRGGAHLEDRESAGGVDRGEAPAGEALQRAQPQRSKVDAPGRVVLDGADVQQNVRDPHRAQAVGPDRLHREQRPVHDHVVLQHGNPEIVSATLEQHEDAALFRKSLVDEPDDIGIVAGPCLQEGVPRDSARCVGEEPTIG